MFAASPLGLSGETWVFFKTKATSICTFSFHDWAASRNVSSWRFFWCRPPDKGPLRPPVTDHLHHGEASDVLSLIDAADLGHALILRQIVGGNFLLANERPDFEPAVQSANFNHPACRIALATGRTRPVIAAALGKWRQVGDNMCPVRLENSDPVILIAVQIDIPPTYPVT